MIFLDFFYLKMKLSFVIGTSLLAFTNVATCWTRACEGFGLQNCRWTDCGFTDSSLGDCDEDGLRLMTWTKNLGIRDLSTAARDLQFTSRQGLSEDCRGAYGINGCYSGYSRLWCSVCWLLHLLPRSIFLKPCNRIRAAQPQQSQASLELKNALVRTWSGSLPLATQESYENLYSLVFIGNSGSICNPGVAATVCRRIQHIDPRVFQLAPDRLLFS